MATRQQLRGDGSKEYQIITNLSRGINNAVADDVLVDNAFRDVVNFSSDQLGNISKRDNLLNSNFKEFIRKLAYGDFNLDTFNIEHYTNDEKPTYMYNYKGYSYGRIDQIILQNFYEMAFTNKHYLSSMTYASYSGVAKKTNGSSFDYIKVPTFMGSPYLDTEEAQELGYTKDTIDTEIIKETFKLGVDSANYILNRDFDEETLTYTISCTDLKGNPLKIVPDTVPEGWTIVDETKIYKKASLPVFWENLPLTFETTNELGETQYIYKPTSVCRSTYYNPGRDDFYKFVVRMYDKGDYYEVFIYHINNMNGHCLGGVGVDNDYGWEIKSCTREEYPELVIGTLPVDFMYKKFYKNTLVNDETKLITFYDWLGAIPLVLSFTKNEVQVVQPNYYRYANNWFEISNAILKKVYVIEHNNFFNQLQNLDELFKEGDYVNNQALNNDCTFDAYFIYYANVNLAGGNLKNNITEDEGKGSGVLPNHLGLNFYASKNPVAGNPTLRDYSKCIMIYRLKIEITKAYSITVTPTLYTYGDSFVYNLPEQKNITVGSPNTYIITDKNDDSSFDLFMAKYSNYLYLTTGYASLLRLSIIESSPYAYVRSIGSNNGYDPSGAVKNPQINIYAPVPYEVTNPGFNLLAKKPLTYIEKAGNVEKVRGVFYTTEDDSNVLTTVPCNLPFNIHVISTGSSSPNKPKIRPNNGELDENKNPYKDLPGSWTSTFVFKCSGIDVIEAYEMKITKGEDEFLTYFTPEPYVPKEIGKISDISRLIYGCTRLKIINNQLILFGNGGYVFFSDFDNFEYFPNYYYMYVANGTDEEIVDIVYFRQFYAIFTNKRILRMSGDFGTDNFEIGPLNDFMGCSNHSTIRQVYNSLYFVGYNGIYSLNQGYLGSGTENLKRVDTQLTDTFNFDNVLYCYVMGNIYIIIMKDGTTWYTYDVDNDMFLRYTYSIGDSSVLNSVNFIETLEENQIYAILTTTKNNNTFTDSLLLYNFPLVKDVNYDYKDSGEGYISSFETPYINLGTPTNTKKFKNLFIKMYNETDSLIPLYVTVYVDDILAITPEDYTIELDEETNTYYYYFKVDNNAELLKAHNLLGELTLGKDTLGDNIIQQLKLKINAKGRAIKIILADGYDYPNKDNSAIIKYRNNKKFSISTIGIVYKLKKVKEG